MYAVEITTLMPGRLGADVVDERPELPARERIHARRRFVQHQQIRVVNQRAAEAHLLLHAARELAGGTLRKGPSPVASSSCFTIACGAPPGEPEQPRHEVHVVVDAELEIEVLAQALRHVSDTRPDCAAMAQLADVAAEDRDLALLQLLRAGDQRHQRRLSDAVRAHDAAP